MAKFDTNWKNAKTFLDILPYLTPKQKLFVEYYTDNGTKAAAEAGYKGSDNALAVSADRLLTSAKIVKALQLKNAGSGIQARIMDRKELQLTWSQIARDANGASMSDRLKAMDSLAKSQGLFIDRVEVKGAIAHLSMRELVKHIESKAKVLGINVELPALPELEVIDAKDT